VKLYASDLQTFLGGRAILREVEEEEMHVTTLLEDKCLQQVNLCYRPDEKMAAINNIEIYLHLGYVILSGHSQQI
jgi:hypothetical protein